MPNPLDLHEQHVRYRELVKRLYANWLPDDPRRLVYESIEAFEQEHPDRVKFAELLTCWEREFVEIEQSVDESIQKIQENGLTYQDIELLRHEFPRPDEEEYWE